MYISKENFDSKPENWQVLGWAFLFAFFVFGLYLRLKAFGSVHIGGHEWLTRDMDRALSIIDGSYFPLAGPETNAGSRLPGPFMYIFLAIPLIISRSYESIFVFNFILNLASVLGIFFFLKKYFVFYFSLIATSLFSISCTHISSVGHPINPVYIFPFLVLFLWFLFEFILGKKEGFLAWSFLILCLAVQFHYSMAVFFFVPFVLMYFFKRKISRETIFRCLMVGVLCFLPYFVFKLTVHQPQNDGAAGTFRAQKTDPLNVLKALLLQDEIKRVAWNFPFYPIPNREDFDQNEAVRIARQIGLSLVFYYLCFYVLFKIRKGRLADCNREIILIALFFFPAAIYQIVKPFVVHHWYAYIYILPTILIISWFVIHCFEMSKGLIAKILFLIVLFLMGTHSSIVYGQILGSVRTLTNNLIAGTYENSKYLIGGLMSELGLSPEEYYRRVYFIDFRPTSLNRIKFAYKEMQSKYNKTADKESNSCFFIFDEKGHNMVKAGVLPGRLRKNYSKNKISLNEFRLYQFKADRTIKIRDHKTVSFAELGFPQSFDVYEYIPLQTQSCYRNSYNPFVSSKKVRDFLMEANYKSRAPVKTLFSDEKYDSNQKLLSFNGEYIIKNKTFQTPFKFSISIFRRNLRYFMRGELLGYYFWGDNNFHMRHLNVYITSFEDPKNKLLMHEISTPIRRFSKASLFSILSENTFVSINNSLSTYNSNQEWFREVALPKKLILRKNRFYLDLDYKMGSSYDGLISYFDLSNNGFIKLKSPNIDN